MPLVHYLYGVLPILFSFLGFGWFCPFLMVYRALIRSLEHFRKIFVHFGPIW